MSRMIAFVERAFDNRFDAVAAVSENFRVDYWNEAMESLTRIPRVGAVGARLHDLFPRLRATGADDILRRALAGDHVVGERPFFGAADRARAHEYEWFATPLCDGGRIRGAALIARSGAAHGSIAEQMAETDQRFRAMADSSPVLLWMSGVDGLCNFFNSTWLAFSGRTMEQELGVGWAEGVHPEDFEHCMNTYMRAFAARDQFEMEYRLRRHDGDYRWILDRGAPRFAPSGEFVGFIGSCVDITDRKLAEEQTRALARELERANLYMERLLYAVSHDLREPVRNVVAYVDRLGERLAGDVDPQAARYVQFASSSAAQLRDLVDGLLEFARLRRRSLAVSRVDLAASVSGAVADLAPAIAAAGATIDVRDLPAINGDAALLRRMFAALIDNAIKFRGDAPPRVEITSERLGDEWTLCIADNGIGFEPEYAEKIFDMFARLHRREDYPGSGIGLALARDIVDRHRGRLWARSTPGRGARFTIALPAS